MTFPAVADQTFAPANPHAPTSAVIENLLTGFRGEFITVGQLVDRLGARPFGIVLLLLAVISFVPGASGIAGVLLLLPAGQMLFARQAPMLPAFVTRRQIRTARLASVLRRTVPWLVRIERIVRPRWATPFQATKRVVGAVTLLLGATLIAPIPLSNFVPGAVIVLIALAYLEEDGLVLSIALVAAALSLAVTGVEAWAAFGAAQWIGWL